MIQWPHRISLAVKDAEFSFGLLHGRSRCPLWVRLLDSLISRRGHCVWHPPLAWVQDSHWMTSVFSPSRKLADHPFVASGKDYSLMQCTVSLGIQRTLAILNICGWVTRALHLQETFHLVFALADRGSSPFSSATLDSLPLTSRSTLKGSANTAEYWWIYTLSFPSSASISVPIFYISLRKTQLFGWYTQNITFWTSFDYHQTLSAALILSSGLPMASVRPSNSF